MQIIVLSRVKFRNLFKKKDINLSAFRFISINSLGQKTPLPKEFLHKSLVLHFEDCKFGEKFTSFRKNHAERIKDFVDDTIKTDKGIIVHCNHGVSRSGAVSTAINDYVNKYAKPNKADWENFNKKSFHLISPHPQILEKLKEEFGIL